MFINTIMVTMEYMHQHQNINTVVDGYKSSPPCGFPKWNLYVPLEQLQITFNKAMAMKNPIIYFGDFPSKPPWKSDVPGFSPGFCHEFPWISHPDIPSIPLGSRVVAAVDPVERPSSRPQQGQHPERRRTGPRRMAVLPALLPRERQGSWTLGPGITWWLIPLSKWVITPVISGLTLLIPFITGVITHLLSGMSHQVVQWLRNWM